MKKIAIPTKDGKLHGHFGHAPFFALYETEDGQVKSETHIEAPPHKPGHLPVFLAGHGVNVVIAGGIGAHAVEKLEQNGVEVYAGAASKTPGELVSELLDGKLSKGESTCHHH